MKRRLHIVIGERPYNDSKVALIGNDGDELGLLPVSDIKFNWDIQGRDVPTAVITTILPTVDFILDRYEIVYSTYWRQFNNDDDLEHVPKQGEEIMMCEADGSHLRVAQFDHDVYARGGYKGQHWAKAPRKPLVSE